MNIIGVSSVQTKLIQEVKCNTAYDQSVFFFFTEKNFLEPVKKIGFPPLKTKSYPWKFLRNNPWNKSLSREKSAKNQPVKHKFLGVKKLKDWAVKLTKIPFFYLFLTRENKILTREKTWKNTREKFDLPVKFWGKVPVKKIFYPWKKPKKQQKSVFTGSFGFHGKKKHCDQSW